MTSIYDSITNDENPPIDFSKIDLKKLKAPLKSLQPKSGRELSAGGGQNTIATTAAKSNTEIIDHFSIYDSIGL